MLQQSCDVTESLKPTRFFHQEFNCELQLVNKITEPNTDFRTAGAKDINIYNTNVLINKEFIVTHIYI